MEKESFEDAEIAELLNRDYIAIKVDREERPDIDHVYMTVCQAMTGQGGWPLTIIMTPEKKPFFAGTYFPKHRKFNRYGLSELLPSLAENYRNNHDRVLEISESIVEETGKRMVANLEGEIGEDILDQAYEAFTQMYDEKYGGFGSAPKFPSSHNLSFLLRYAKSHPDSQALSMVETTLELMRRGGIYDHVGFGFARYSTDEQWLVPHFEKMLYDNAMLAMTYTEAFQLTGEDLYRETAEQILVYVLRDMTDPTGGFYSAEDADSEGQEGKFYVWRPEEVKAVLGDADGEWFCEIFDISEQGNFEGDSIPNLLYTNLDPIAKAKQLTADELWDRVWKMREKLFAERERRVHPHKDDKILTAWNGLMIAAMAGAAKAFGQPRYLEAASKAAEFIERQMVTEEGRLLARYRDGEAAIPAFLDDYAFLVWGLLELYEASWEPEYLKKAMMWTKRAFPLFWDDEKGGFFFYGNDQEALFNRNKEIYDGAMPSGNSVFALNLVRLSNISGDEIFSEKAEQLFSAFAGALAHHPPGHAMLLCALSMAASGGKQIVVAGEPDHLVTKEMLGWLQRQYLPDAALLFKPAGEAGKPIADLIPMLADKQPADGKTTAYVCTNFACRAPVTTLEELQKSILN